MGGGSGSSEKTDIERGGATITLEPRLVKVLKAEAKASKTPVSRLVSQALRSYINNRLEYRAAVEDWKAAKKGRRIPLRELLKKP